MSARNKRAAIRAKASTGEEFQLQSEDVQAPILPADDIAKLYQIDKALVDFVLIQTKAEAEHRRSMDKRVAWYVFFERTLGQICAVALGLAGIVGGIYAGVNGNQPWLGGIIASTTIGTLAVAFIFKNSRK